MLSKSYTNLLDLASGNFPVMSGGGVRKRLPRVMTVPGIVSELDDDQANSVSSDVPSSVVQDRMIIVANQLPLKARRRPDGMGWSFSWDDESLLLQLKDGFSDDMEVIYVGSLRVDVDPADQDDVSQTLLERFKCVPAFLPPEIASSYYHGFCKQQLWPLFHYMLPFSVDHGGRFDRSLWEAYVSANKFFSQKVIEVLNPEDDYVWIHDYHLMVLPTFLRRRFNRLRMGFFLHSPFPSSEIYRTLPVREEILKALLNADLIGFHTFDYARHFLSCCGRMLGLEYQSKRGYIGLEYYGRTIGIKITPVGVHMEQIESVLSLADNQWRVEELKRRFQGKTVLLGVDDMDIFKGINLKLLAMEQMLKLHSDWRGTAVLVQIANPARGQGRDLEEIQREIQLSCKRINETFGQPGYEPVVYIDQPMSIAERFAFYTIAECVIVTAVRDGMNLTPYEYIACRQGKANASPTAVSESGCGGGPRKSMLVVSEFVGCSPSLSGAIRVNPWNIEATAEAMNEAISMLEGEKQLRHEKHYRYVSTHDVAYWSRSFMLDMERTCKDHFRRRCWGIGLSFGFRVVALDPNFRKLSIDAIVSAYERSKSRVIMLDYDGTVMPQFAINKTPSTEVISIINTLCGDKRNIVFLGVSKGLVAEKILNSMVDKGVKADFVLCIGDDRSDEDMFECIGSAVNRELVSPNTAVFACTVGQKPSKAKYYLDDSTEVVTMLRALAEASDDSPFSSPSTTPWGGTAISP
ncbi:putative alpha,alpha-trehalose-phosphate synthase [UDP-forming] 7 [Acorus gramineus]|uniref:Alpha,alpha-trehalose-phosphate synthase [UDP-forming] 7 n=1 Tax=Acorus gramineus TaxID=55184 RepID=A0AAV9BE52_ACOGR|nr:putative alpha,alpha-trehalose-phosphate synthase [UDP-forming] 7 [Acorus gramineus]